MAINNRKNSSIILDGFDRAASRGMLRAVGFQEEDFKKPKIGIASTWSMVTPCNMHIDELSRQAGKGVDKSGGKSVIFNTITVSDGISMGTGGMRYSMVSREVIADSIETVTGGEGFDGIITIGGCDKNIPACAMAMVRLNRPSIFVYGGSIQPGKNRTDIVSIFEAIGARAAGKISDQKLLEIEQTAIPGAGSCGGMYTANTMATAVEALGLSLPNSSAQEAVSMEKQNDCQRAGKTLMRLVERDLKPSDILTKKSFENAITTVIAIGGSTNAVLHLLAIAHSANIDLSLTDFMEIGKHVPVLADVKPSGKYLMSELIAIGGVMPLMKVLLEKGLLHGDCMTVSGKTLAENLAEVKPYPEGQNVIRDFDNPIKPDSHLRILGGNLAEEGAVAKISGKEGLFFEGNAKVYDSEEESMKAILSGKIVKNDVIVIRYEGPKGGPGMREMLGPTSAIMGRGLGKEVALITDGRFSGGSHGFVIGHITPEAFNGGMIGLLKNGDKIRIDVKKNTIDALLDAEEIQRRKVAFKPVNKIPTRGVLAKYASSVKSASFGAVTD